MLNSFQWNLGTQQFTDENECLKELKWSSPPTNYPTADWKQHYNSLSTNSKFKTKLNLS